MKEPHPYLRFVSLTKVLERCTEIEDRSLGRNKIFTIGERIAINQERGSILSQVAYGNSEITIQEVRTYEVSIQIENKIQFTLTQIQHSL